MLTCQWRRNDIRSHLDDSKNRLQTLSRSCAESQLVHVDDASALAAFAALDYDETVAGPLNSSPTRTNSASLPPSPPDWEHRNAEIVIPTDAIRDHTGPPCVVATHFWLYGRVSAPPPGFRPPQALNTASPIGTRGARWFLLTAPQS